MLSKFPMDILICYGVPELGFPIPNSLFLIISNAFLLVFWLSIQADGLKGLDRYLCQEAQKQRISYKFKFNPDGQPLFRFFLHGYMCLSFSFYVMGEC